MNFWFFAWGASLYFLLTATSPGGIILSGLWLLFSSIVIFFGVRSEKKK